MSPLFDVNVQVVARGAAHGQGRKLEVLADDWVHAISRAAEVIEEERDADLGDELDLTEPERVDNWFAALGKPVPRKNLEEVREWLVSEGYDEFEVSLTLTVVARDIEHDKPDIALATLRGLLGNNETMVIMTVAKMCSRRAT